MAWSDLPCSTSTTVKVALWDELRAAMDERNPLVGSPLTLPTNFDANTLRGKIAEYQAAVKTLTDCGIDGRTWADTPANEFETLITGATATGRKNVFERALTGGASTDFTVDWTAKEQRKHWNEPRTVLNVLCRVKLEDALPTLTTGGAYLSDTSALEATFAAARTSALTGLNGGAVWFPSFDLTFGRTAEVTANPDPAEWEVSASHIGELYGDLDTSWLAGYTVADAWVLVERFALPTGDGYHTSNFDFKIQVGPAGGALTDVRTGITTGDAADITGFWSPNIGTPMDVWQADVDPADINTAGDTRVKLVYTDTATADDATWTDSGEILVNAYNNLVAAWLVLEVTLDYHT